MKFPHQPFPFGAFPHGVQAALLEVNMLTGAPHELSFSCLLAVSSLVIQHLADVSGPAHCVVPVSVFVAVIAKSNERKSSVLRLFLRSVVRHEQALRAAAEEAVKSHKSAQAVWKAQRRGLERAVSKAADSGASDSDELMRRLHQHLAAEPIAPTIPRLLFEDSTVEALLAALATSAPSAGLITSEGSTVLGARLAELMGALCALWSGDPILVDRIVRGTVRLSGEERLTICVLTQLEPLQDFMQAHGVRASDIGFWGRLLVCAPPSLQGSRPVHDVLPSLVYLQRFEDLISKLLTVPRAKRLVLDFTPDARQLLNELARDWEAMCAPASPFADIAAALGKAAEYTARLAAIFHILDGLSMDEPIERKVVGCAGTVMNWFLSQHWRLFGPTSEISAEQQDAEKLRIWLASYSQNSPGMSMIRKTEISQYGPPFVRGNRVRRDVALGVLAAQGFLQFTRINKTDVVQLNPAHFPSAAQL